VRHPCKGSCSPAAIQSTQGTAATHNQENPADEDDARPGVRQNSANLFLQDELLIPHPLFQLVPLRRRGALRTRYRRAGDRLLRNLFLHRFVVWSPASYVAGSWAVRGLGREIIERSPILRCLGVDPLRPKGKEVPATDARPRWQSRGEARRGQKVATTSLPAREKGVGQPCQRGCYRTTTPCWGGPCARGAP
jgi:hypothetical protein